MFKKNRPRMIDPGAYEAIDVRPASGLIGCEVSGVDLREVSGAALDEIKRAFADHLVVVFRDQHDLTREEHIEFSKNFGEILRIPHFPSLPDYPDIGLVHRAAEDQDSFFGETFHSDSTFFERPPTAVVMRAMALPPAGGDTAFANLYAAYESLSDGMRKIVDELYVVHNDQRIWTDVELIAKIGVQKEESRCEAIHPLAVTHPITGRKSIFLNSLLSIRFEHMTEEESTPLLNYLIAHSEFLPFTFRVRWEPGTVVLWDNWAASHSAIGDYEGYPRTMERVTLHGPRP